MYGLDQGAAECRVGRSGYRRSEDVAVCIRYCEANRDRMRREFRRNRRPPVGSGVGKSAYKHIVRNRFKKPGATDRKWVPTHRSPSDAA